MDSQRFKYLDRDEEGKLTQEELDQGWHWCYDFDGMLVGPGTVEAEHCSCNTALKDAIAKEENNGS